jgi:hypothetical protein
MKTFRTLTLALAVICLLGSIGLSTTADAKPDPCKGLAGDALKACRGIEQTY